MALTICLFCRPCSHRFKYRKDFKAHKYVLFISNIHEQPHPVGFCWPTNQVFMIGSITPSGYTLFHPMQPGQHNILSDSLQKMLQNMQKWVISTWVVLVLWMIFLEITVLATRGQCCNLRTRKLHLVYNKWPHSNKQASKQTYICIRSGSPQ